MDSPTSRGMTVGEFASAYRIGPDRVRSMITRGELGAVNVGTTSRPRMVILPHHATAFELVRAAAPPRPQRRRRRAAGMDYYPEPAGPV